MANNTPAANDDHEVLLEMRDLRIDGRRDDQWHEIIKGIDLTLHRGEVLGLIGESGAGKSTLGIAAMGYVKPGCRFSGGRITFDGIDMLTASEEKKQALRGVRIAYVAQSAAASFNPAHKLIDQFAEIPVQHHKSSKAEAYADAKDLYSKLQLPEPEQIGFRYPHQVSGGQLQRAMTAMAMSCRPDLIIFDEPTTALDVTTQIEVLMTMKDIVEQFNTAAIYITHDLAVVAQMADRIMVLRYGELVEEAPTRVMLANPKQAYTKSLWAVRSFRKTSVLKTQQQATQPIISVQNVTAAYGVLDILHEISFDLQRGQTVSVVGESGSGKSTTARVITGLLPPRLGQVLFQGQALPPDYRQRSKDQLRQVQMIYQMADTAINPRQRVREIIGRPLSFYLGMDSQQVETRTRELLAMIELNPDQFIDRFPSELSGGQKQRICIARALAAEPQCIICDEVTSALDQLVAEGILRLLDRLQRELNLAYMFITHDLATVKAISDEVVVMLKGKIVEQGSKDKIFSPPYPEYTEKLLASVPQMNPDWMKQLIAQRESRS
ncbi:peptide/nickel transport system ATP-binding protein [Thiothrix eikelboomii]|uniref:Peptide/nickel transport system ATP-binding protein n=1 Tax=Thiothrix eikelboomii TaxID=92487 RepID=A0A1T4XKG6_9GAMM|nr:ABC transporter ATP-binding protein [Thiothrix eikelboomii]SKA89648.1 peptide/nickel transport system ATP-binding protein [Thiothrix eikelboomii]